MNVCVYENFSLSLFSLSKYIHVYIHACIISFLIASAENSSQYEKCLRDKKGISVSSLTAGRLDD